MSLPTENDTAGAAPFDYRAAGVDIEAGEALVRKLGPIVKRTMRPEVLAGVGGFGALIGVDLERYRAPVMVAGTDGVGTKLLYAHRLGRLDTVGIDLVAMCVNDILVHGAEPLFFLDYYACGRLEVDDAATVIGGIAEGCAQAGCALVGGETAEMPGLYRGGEFDLAGFAVGLVERERIIDGSAVAAGDLLIGLASSGPHSNGYSLIRKLVDRRPADLGKPCGEVTLGEALLAPTRIYVRTVLPLIASHRPAALAHITGGGLIDNIVRSIPAGLGIRLDAGSWPEPPVFCWLRETSALPREALWRTFNCGIGFVLVIAPGNVPALRRGLEAAGEAHWVIGEVVPAKADAPRVTISDG